MTPISSTWPTRRNDVSASPPRGGYVPDGKPDRRLTHRRCLHPLDGFAGRRWMHSSGGTLHIDGGQPERRQVDRLRCHPSRRSVAWKRGSCRIGGGEMDRSHRRGGARSRRPRPESPGRQRSNSSPMFARMTRTRSPSRSASAWTRSPSPNVTGRICPPLELSDVGQHVIDGEDHARPGMEPGDAQRVISALDEPFPAGRLEVGQRVHAGIAEGVDASGKPAGGEERWLAIVDR